MRRFFCPAENISDKRAKITEKDEIHHILHVLRLDIEDKLIIFDGKSREYVCKIVQYTNEGIILEIVCLMRPRNQTTDICIACALPKGKNFSFIVEKLTELGINEIVPVITTRTVAKPDLNKLNAKLEHWKRIALNAAKQSRRTTLPVIGSVICFKEALSYAAGFYLKLIACLNDKNNIFISNVLNKKNDKVFILIGPEGDFTDAEVEMALKSGFKSATLGNNVLKVETAAIFAASVLISYAES